MRHNDTYDTKSERWISFKTLKKWFKNTHQLQQNSKRSYPQIRDFPRVAELTPGELDYLMRHLDHFLLKDSTEDMGKTNRGEWVGYLEEFRLAQK